MRHGSSWHLLSAALCGLALGCGGGGVGGGGGGGGGGSAGTLSEQVQALDGAAVFFGHNSVGANIMSGLSAVLAEESGPKPTLVQTQDPNAVSAGVFAHYGIGGLLAVAVWCELGDCQRFARSLQVVRHTGLDVTVDSSDRRRASGFLSRQGPELLGWALYEAAKNSSHARSPDHHYYAAVKKSHDGKIAAISMAPKLARRCYHTLRSVHPDLVYATP